MITVDYNKHALCIAFEYTGVFLRGMPHWFKTIMLDCRVNEIMHRHNISKPYDLDDVIRCTEDRITYYFKHNYNAIYKKKILNNEHERVTIIFNDPGYYYMLLLSE